MGILISELGRESNLKLVVASVGLSGLILCEQDTMSNDTIAEKIISFPFMFFINSIKISKERKRNG